METRITKERVENTSGGKETFWVLWELGAKDAPWVAIEDSKNRAELERYQKMLNR